MLTVFLELVGIIGLLPCVLWAVVSSIGISHVLWHKVTHRHCSWKWVRRQSLGMLLLPMLIAADYYTNPPKGVCDE